MNNISLEIKRIEKVDNYSGNRMIAPFICSCEKTNDVIANVEMILLIVLKKSLGEWPVLEEWRGLLPIWFVNKFRDEYTPKEVETLMKKMKKMSLQEKSEYSKNSEWTLSGWLHWFEPQNREWEYHSISDIKKDSFNFNILVDGWPFPHGVIDWLLKNCGVSSFLIE